MKWPEMDAQACHIWPTFKKSSSSHTSSGPILLPRSRKCFWAVSSLAQGTRIGLSAESPSPSIGWRSVLWPGDWRILLICIYILSLFTESLDQVERRMIFLECGWSGNRTRVTQPELTLFRALYPLDQRSFIVVVATLIRKKCCLHFMMTQNGRSFLVAWHDEKKEEPCGHKVHFILSFRKHLRPQHFFC